MSDTEMAAPAYEAINILDGFPTPEEEEDLMAEVFSGAHPGVLTNLPTPALTPAQESSAPAASPPASGPALCAAESRLDAPAQQTPDGPDRTATETATLQRLTSQVGQLSGAIGQMQQQLQDQALLLQQLTAMVMAKDAVPTRRKPRRTRWDLQDGDLVVRTARQHLQQRLSRQ